MKIHVTASNKYSKSILRDDPINAVRVAEEDDNWGQVEYYISSKLGLFLDFSGVRFSSGPVLIFSDPDLENDSDMWLGDDDELVATIDYYDYCEYVANNILCKPKSQWSDLYRKFLESLIIQ